jgi:hypothetical protein
MAFPVMLLDVTLKDRIIKNTVCDRWQLSPLRSFLPIIGSTFVMVRFVVNYVRSNVVMSIHLFFSGDPPVYVK